MRSVAGSKIVGELRKLDWALLRGSALLSIGTGIARVLGLAFSLVLAAVFSASDYGMIRYSIILASIVSLGTQPFGQHVIARFIGKNNHDPERLDSSLSNLFFVLSLVTVATLVIAIPALRYSGKLNIGVLVIFAGETLFYAYWGLCRGLMDPYRLTAAYLGSNLIQILLVWFLIQVLGIRSPTLALLIYGLSYLLPLTVLVLFWPLPGHIRPHLVERRAVSELLRFSLPVWISQACYVLCVSLDILVLERVVTAGELGAYSFSKTLASVFILVPTGIATLLMPRVAASAAQAHRQVLAKMLSVTMLVNGTVLAIYVPLIQPFTQRIFGSTYVVQLGVSLLLASYMIASGIHTLITAVLVGSGRPEAESASRVMDLVATAMSIWILVPRYGVMGAAIGMLTGKVVALLSYGVLYLAKAGVPKGNSITPPI